MVLKLQEKLKKLYYYCVFNLAYFKCLGPTIHELAYCTLKEIFFENTWVVGLSVIKMKS